MTETTTLPAAAVSLENESIQKEAKKILKKRNNDESLMKFKELTKTVVSNLMSKNGEDSKDNNNHKNLLKQVKRILQQSTDMFHVEDKYVTLLAKKKDSIKTKTKKRLISTEPTTTNESGGQEATAAVVEESKTKKLKGNSASNTSNDTTTTSAIPVATWRTENKIVVLSSSDDEEGQKKSIDLQKNDQLFPWSSFADASGKIHTSLITHCTTTSKFLRPSPIQAQSWPILCSQRDMVGIAETGSGKTLAFTLPALSAMCKDDNTKISKRRAPRMLVLSPTRELAMQSADVLETFGSIVHLRSLTVYGGVPKHTQVAALREANIDCIVATPGRIKDLIQEKSCQLQQIQYLVLDEADRMLDMGFEEDVKYIIAQCKHSHRQTAMFSATWPAAIQNIALHYMKDPIRVYVGFEAITKSSNNDNNDGAGDSATATTAAFCGVDDSLSANKRVQQIVEVIEDRQRFGRLREILNLVHVGNKKKDRVLVFALYKLEAERLEKDLRRDGWYCNSIHGNKNQQARTAALSEFKDGTCPLLIATDVAARGLDIPNVECVINYTFPLTIEDYVHRIGRTGRAGKSGISYTFFQPTDKSHAGELQQVLRQVGQPIPDDLAKFGSTIKKKEHKMYGSFGPKTGITKKATKITFDDDDDE